MLFQYPVEEAEKLVEGFENCTLPKEDWTHEAHLLAGMKMCIVYGENAFLKMKERVIRYNVSVGGINSESSGYHDTLTLYWIWLINNFCKKNNITAFNQYAIDTLLSDESIGGRNSFLTYYSKDLMLSSQARLNIILPDLQPMEGIEFFKIA